MFKLLKTRFFLLIVLASTANTNLLATDWSTPYSKHQSFQVSRHLDDNMVVLRYWHNGGTTSVGHASLETKDQYLSFWPSIANFKEKWNHLIGRKEVTATFNHSMESDYISEEYNYPKEFKVVSCPSDKIQTLNRYISNLRNYDYHIRWCLHADMSDICSSENQNCISVAANGLKYAKISSNKFGFFRKRLPKWIMELPLDGECEIIFDSRKDKFQEFADTYPITVDEPAEKEPMPDVEFNDNLDLTLDEAIKQNKKNLVKYLLDSGHQLPDACLWDVSDPEMIELLIAYGADCQHKRWDYSTEHVTRDGKRELDIDYILKRVDKDHSSPVARAIIKEYSTSKNREESIEQNQTKIARLFQESVAAINSDDHKVFVSTNAKMMLHKFQDDDGKSLLHYAVMKKRYGMVRYLLNIGSDPDLLDNRVESPRQIANTKDDDILSKIFDQYDTAHQNISEVFSWVEEGNVNAMEQYLENGGNPFAINNKETLLEFSVRLNQLELVHLLLSRVIFKTEQLQRAYNKAVQNGLENIAFLLIQKDPRLANFPPLPEKYQPSKLLATEVSLFVTASLAQALKGIGSDDDEEDDDEEDEVVYSGRVNSRLRYNYLYSQASINKMNIFDKSDPSWDVICEYVINSHSNKPILSDSMYLKALKWAIIKQKDGEVIKLLKLLPESAKSYSENESPNQMSFGDKFDELIVLALQIDSKLTRRLIDAGRQSNSKLLTLAAKSWRRNLSEQEILNKISETLINHFKHNPSLFYDFLSENISNIKFAQTWVHTVRNRHSKYFEDALSSWWHNGKRMRLIEKFRKNREYDLASSLELDKDSKINSVISAILKNDQAEYEGLLRNYDKWTDNDLCEMITAAAKQEDFKILRNIYKQKDAIKKGKTATSKLLHEFAEKGNFELVKVLLEFGQADTHLGNDSGFSALALAAKNGDIDMAKLLVSNGALISCSSNMEKIFFSNPRTQCPIQVARDNGHEALADWLILAKS